MHPEFDVINEALLDLVRGGELLATARSQNESVVFVDADVATQEDREFTRMWLLAPYFRCCAETEDQASV